MDSFHQTDNWEVIARHLEDLKKNVIEPRINSEHYAIRL